MLINTKIIPFIFIFSLCYQRLQSQCITINNTITSGEKISYEVYYNWGFLWFNAAEVYFKTDSLVQNNVPLYHFISKGSTHENYDWFFKVRDCYESYVDARTFKPFLANRNTSEGNYKVNERYAFNQSKGLLYSSVVTSKKPLKLDTLKVPPCIFDVLSATYYARNIDFSKYKPGDKIPIDIIIDNEIFNLYIRYIGRETITNKDKSRYRCIKFKALIIEGSIFKGGEDLTVWVSDDETKIPVYIEARILVGTIKAYIIEATGLRHPMTGKIANAKK